MTSDIAVAMPGDPDLDCHLYPVRIAGIVHAGVLARTGWLEAAVEFDVSDAGGFWVDRHTRVAPPGPVTITFGVEAAAFPAVAAELADTLETWRDHGEWLELTCAPRKLTRLASRLGVEMVLPRTGALATGGG